MKAEVSAPARRYPQRLPDSSLEALLDPKFFPNFFPIFSRFFSRICSRSFSRSFPRIPSRFVPRISSRSCPRSCSRSCSLKKPPDFFHNYFPIKKNEEIPGKIPECFLLLSWRSGWQTDRPTSKEYHPARMHQAASEPASTITSRAASQPWQRSDQPVQQPAAYQPATTRYS